MRSCVQMYVPAHQAIKPDVERALIVVHKHCRGATVTHGRGVWLDKHDASVTEPVSIYKWWMPDDVDQYGVVGALNHVIRLLHAHGEEEILVEFTNQHNGTTAYIYPKQPTIH